MPFASPMHARFALAGIVAGLVLSTPAIADTSNAVAASTTPYQKSMLDEMQGAFEKIADSVEPSVVNIKAERVHDDSDSGADPDNPDDQQPPDPKNKGDKGSTPDIPLLPRGPHRSESTGSGVIISSDGYILTNDHVVKGADDNIVTVTLEDGRQFKGIVFSDFKSDLAVVKIDAGKSPLPTASFADSLDVKPGQWAIAVGSPFDLENTMTVGVISAIGRHQSIPGETANDTRYYPELIQTDAAINPGNSGGPLFNIDGKVVGINVAIESPVEGSAGIGFAIPSDIARDIMGKLIKFGKVTRGYLGVAPTDLTPALAQEFLQPTGAFVQDIAQDSPAWDGGLRAADIITYYDSKAVTGEVSLRDYIADTDPGTKVKIEYVRGGVPAVTDVTIGAIPSTEVASTVKAPPAPEVPMKPTLGLEIRDLTPKDRSTQGYPPDIQGAFVVAVDPGSPADEASEIDGAQLTNTVIQKIGTHVIKDKADVESALKSIEGQPQTTVVFLMNVDNKFHQTAVTINF